MLSYIKTDLVGDLLEDKNTDEQKEQLMETGVDDQRKINESAAALKASKEALETIKELTSRKVADI